jgi:hypothetical protein
MGSPIAAIIGAIAGVGWGLLVGLVSMRPLRRLPKLSRRWLFVTAFIAATLFGGTLFAMLMYSAPLTSENIFRLMRPPFSGGFTFFVIFNSLMEWLAIPVAVFLNWQHPRRRPCLFCARFFFTCRAPGHTFISFRAFFSSWQYSLVHQYRLSSQVRL